MIPHYSMIQTPLTAPFLNVRLYWTDSSLADGSQWFVSLQLDFPHFNLSGVSTTNQKCSWITTRSHIEIVWDSLYRMKTSSHLSRCHWKTSGMNICLNDLQFIDVVSTLTFKIGIRQLRHNIARKRRKTTRDTKEQILRKRHVSDEEEQICALVFIAERFMYGTWNDIMTDSCLSCESWQGIGRNCFANIQFGGNTLLRANWM